MSYKEAIAAGIIVAAALFAGESRGASPPDRPAVKEASIPFVNTGSIRDWRADGTKVVYIQDIHGDWYRASLMSDCTDLPFVETIGFETRGPDTLDRFGTILVRGQRCPIEAMVKSAAPPSKRKHHKQSADKKASPGY